MWVVHESLQPGGGVRSLSLTERTPIILQLYPRSRIGFWEKYYNALIDITHYFSSVVGFTNIVQSAGQFGAKMKYKLCEVNGYTLYQVP